MSKGTRIKIVIYGENGAPIRPGKGSQQLQAPSRALRETVRTLLRLGIPPTSLTAALFGALSETLSFDPNSLKRGN